MTFIFKMRLLTFFLLIFATNGFSKTLNFIIKDTYENLSKEQKELSLKEFWKIEYFIQSPKVKDKNALINAEFLSFVLKNPVAKNFNRYPFQEESLNEEFIQIESKLEKLKPVSRYLAQQILLEMKNIVKERSFKRYLQQIKKSYYFTSDELKTMDKKVRYLEPWWEFFANTSIAEIDQSILSKSREFISYFSKSVSFILNQEIIPPDSFALSILEKSEKAPEAIEDKLEEIIDDAENQGTEQEDETETAKNDWVPTNGEDSGEEKVKTLNYNIEENYPKPSPNYLSPETLPIPLNDW